MKDITKGGAELRDTTLEGVTFGTTVDSLLAIHYLVFDKKECTMEEIITAADQVYSSLHFCHFNLE